MITYFPEHCFVLFRNYLSQKIIHFVIADKITRNELCICEITSYNLSYHSESILMAEVVRNSAKMQPRQHIRD